MCLFFTVLLAGPRIGIILWWLINPDRWDRAFDTWVWPVLGFLLLPWTTLTFVAVAPLGSVTGWDWLWLTLSFLIDISMWTGGGYSNRNRVPGYA